MPKKIEDEDVAFVGVLGVDLAVQIQEFEVGQGFSNFKGLRNRWED